jgi:hypothetical protein
MHFIRHIWQLIPVSWEFPSLVFLEELFQEISHKENAVWNPEGKYPSLGKLLAFLDWEKQKKFYVRTLFSETYI